MCTAFVVGSLMAGNAGNAGSAGSAWADISIRSSSWSNSSQLLSVRGSTNWIEGSSYFCGSSFYETVGWVHNLTVSSARFGRAA